MRTKLLGIFESVQRCAIMDSQTATGNSVRLHHKEHSFPVAVCEVVTLGSYLAMSASDPSGAPSGGSPVESSLSRLEARDGPRMTSKVALLR